MPNDKPILERAEELGWLYRLPKSPLLVFRAPMTNLLGALTRMIVEKVAYPAGFQEWIFPRIVPYEVLSKTGWLNFHRQEAWLLEQRREYMFDLQCAELFPLQDQFPVDPMPYVLDPIQCVSFYYALFGKTIDVAQLPMKVFEHRGGWTHRYENSPDGLLRGLAFLRLEFVWMARQQDTDGIREDLVGLLKNVLVDDLRLAAKVAEGDSCFEEAGRKNYPQDKIFAAEDVKKLAHLPTIDFLGPWQDDQFVEIASSSRHDRLPKRFEIKVGLGEGKTEAPWSGCLGIGLTRLAASFLSTHGFDPDKWTTPGLRRLFVQGRQ